MKKVSKKIMYLFAVIAMVFSYFIPVDLVRAAAPDNTSEYGIIQVNGALDVQEVTNASEVIGTYEHGTFTIEGSNGLYVDSNKRIYAKGSVIVTATPEQDYNGTIWVNGTNQQLTEITIDAIIPNAVYNVDCDFQPAGGQPQPPQGNTEATINISPGEGTYTINGQNRNYDDKIELSINGSMWDHEAGNTISYNSDAQDDTVLMTFETLWINRFYDEIVINGTSYDVSDYIDFDDRTSWLQHNKGTQLISFDIDDVEKANSYNIVVKHGENNGTRYLATFLWTGDPAQAGGFNYIGHARLELVQATYTVGTVTYIVDGAYLNNRLSRDGDHMTAFDGNYLTYGVKADVDFDDGSLTLPGEATVTMRVVPEYGYQVTSVNGGEDFTTTDEGVSEFTVTVHHGEAGYFQATVEEVEDEVIANADEIKEGTVTIGEDEIDAGTVQLTVDNVDLDEDKIKDFEDAADGNRILTYFDINLNQVLYRGSADSVWSNQIHRLDSEATISLKIEEGIDIDDIVFVHNIDDGDEFEIIEIESWDPVTRIVTFKTDSFSNFAMAEKKASSSSTTGSTDTANPKTGDNILMYFGLLLIGLSGLVLTRKKYAKVK